MTEPTTAPEPVAQLGKRYSHGPEEMARLRAAGIAASKRMLRFIDASPTPYHATANLAAQLREDGFEPLEERDTWSLMPGYRRFVIRDDSTLIAFVVGKKHPARSGFRIVGAHTDSPNLRIKPNAGLSRRGYRQLGVDTYGGVLLSTWMDRDLSVAGRVSLLRDGAVESQLVDLRRPVARISNLAIHLNRDVNDGLVLNKQSHMVPMVGLGDAMDLRVELAAALGCAVEAIGGYDLALYDTQKGTIGGLDDELIFSARLDNLASCYPAVEAICSTPDSAEGTALIALYNHEECGSRSAVGAQSSMLREVIERIIQAYPESEAQAVSRALSRSVLVSADMAHAIHPNYADRHDDEHAPRLNSGLVIKTNVNQSYATSGATAARFATLCAEVGYEPQQFVVRSDLACGSTIGPITAAQLGVATVDVGAPMLSMHSCREVAGSLDVHLAIQTFVQLFK